MTADATPLEAELIRMIEAAGPMPLDRYIALSLGHPAHGYYMTRDPFGQAGDFTTAPEVTQMFGEILGIWCMQCYQLMGRPKHLDLIELGPGRGTLMSDLLRAARVMPDFLHSLSVRLIEFSPVLRLSQEQVLGGSPVPITWHESFEAIAPAPSLIIANEFFDALPIRQFQRLKQGWAERALGAREGTLAIGLVPVSFRLPDWAGSAVEGDVVEIRPAAAHWAAGIAERLMKHPGAALIIDYGHLRSSPGDTLQAVRRHSAVSILDHPGESDLTAHVDFEALTAALRDTGAKPWPPMTQQDFLHAMGLKLRASILARNATAEQKRDLEAALERVAGPRQMGQMFKVLAATSPSLPRPHPFPVEAQ
jgi:SAM-dependent MidA family methyltransferase